MSEVSLVCTSCNGLITVAADAAEAVVCPSCHAGHDRSTLEALDATAARPAQAADGPQLSAAFLQRYELVGFLGRGGMGTVWLMRQLLLPRQVAVKLVHDDSFTETISQRLLKEAHVLGKLNHPRIVQIHDVGLDNGRPFMVMEYVEGETLQQRLKQEPPLSVEQSLRIGIQLLDGLRAAHKQGIVHRDIKPGNIFLTKAGRPKIGDFGLAKIQTMPSGTAIGRISGTPSYMSPEQCRGVEATPASDVYALGLVLFEMLTRRRPFPGPTILDYLTQHTSVPAPRIRTHRPDVPVALETEIAKALEKDPGRRHKTASSLRKALQEMYRRLGHGGDLTPGNDQTPPQVGPSAPNTVDPAAGLRIVERYELVRLLGRGGMGQVWLALDEARDKAPVAVKLLPPELWRDPEARGNIIHEANISLKMGHPNIVRLINLEPGEAPLLVLEYVPGLTLAADLAQRQETGRGPYSPAEMLRILQPLAIALDFAHECKVIHRDIKPSNVLLHIEKERLLGVKLGDFGIAAELAAFHTRQTGLVPAGTLAYMSPEQLACQRLDVRSDIYSLAATVYQMLTLSMPFSGDNLSWAIKHAPVPRPPELSPEVAEVLSASLAKRREDRPSSAREFYDTMCRAIQGGAAGRTPSGRVNFAGTRVGESVPGGVAVATLAASRARGRPVALLPLAASLVACALAIRFVWTTVPPAPVATWQATPRPPSTPPAAASAPASMPAPRPGSLLVVAIPPGLPITDGQGKTIGWSPGPVSLPPGQFSLVVRPGGDYQDIPLQVSVEPGKQVVVRPTMIRRMAQLVVASTPAAADVFINGDRRGAGTLELELPSGVPVEISVRASGFQDDVRRETPRAGTRLQLTVALVPLEVKAAAVATPDPAPTPEPTPAKSSDAAPSLDVATITRRDELLVEALEAFDRDDIQKAARIYSQAAVVDPLHVETHRKIGQCRLLLKQYDLAIRALERAHALAPRNPQLLNSFANALVEAGSPARAVPLALEATRLAPDYAYAWCTLGQAHLALKDWDAAEKALKAAVELDGTLEECSAALALAKRKRK